MLNRLHARPPRLATLLVLLSTISACTSHYHATVKPEPATVFIPAGVKLGGLSVQLHPDIARFQKEERKPVGAMTIAVNFVLGEAIAATVIKAAQCNFEPVVEVDSPTCAQGTDILLTVRFAREPAVQVRWVARVF